MEEIIICPECGHSVDKHYEDYDGGGGCYECKELYPDPDYSTDNVLKWCIERPINIKKEYFEDKAETSQLANKELQRRIIELVNDLRTIVGADVNLSATELRTYAYECLLKKGYISNNKEPV